MKPFKNVVFRGGSNPVRGLSEHSIIIRGGSFRSTGGVFASLGDRGARGGVENDDFGVLSGFPTAPGAENAISGRVPSSPGSLQRRLARFSDGNEIFSTAFLAFWFGVAE